MSVALRFSLKDNPVLIDQDELLELADEKDDDGTLHEWCEENVLKVYTDDDEWPELDAAAIAEWYVKEGYSGYVYDWKLVITFDYMLTFNETDVWQAYNQACENGEYLFTLDRESDETDEVQVAKHYDEMGYFDEVHSMLGLHNADGLFKLDHQYFGELLIQGSNTITTEGLTVSDRGNVYRP